MKTSGCGGLVVALVLVAVLLGLTFMFIPVLFGFLVWAVPIGLFVGAVYSCLTSGKPTNTKLLWLIVILLLPLLGPLLWFFWGRHQA